MKHIRSFAVGLLLAVAACQPQSQPERCVDPAATPTPDWPTSTPEAQGLDSTALQTAADYAQANSSLCLVVIRHGTLVWENYWQGFGPTTPIQTWSLAKSYTSTLVGMAIADGLIHSVDDSASRYVPQWKNTPNETITIRQLLAMTSGLYFEEGADSVGILNAPDMTAQALALQRTSPAGSIWQYSNQAVQVFEPILRSVTGATADVYAQKKLWGPLGMNATWYKDAVGHPSMYMNVMTSCRDHARFGYMMLHKGCWGSKRILNSDWVGSETVPATPSLDKGYGFLWWLNAGAPTLDSVTFLPLATGSYHPFAPASDFCATGLGSQMIEVVPAYDMVVVRAGWAPQDDPALAGNPLAQAAAALNDGQQIVHSGVLQRVLAAVQPE